MAAYLIADIEVTHPAVYEEYRRLAPPPVALPGGKYRVVGGKLDVLEGNCRPRRTIIVGFPSTTNLRALCDSVEYAPLKAIRIRSSDSKVVAAEGV